LRSRCASAKQRQFIDRYETTKGYSDDVKRECLKMYVNGMGFRGIERVKGAPMKLYKIGQQFIQEGDQIVSKTYMTRVEGENTRLRH
jgi:transposase-like protein